MNDFVISREMHFLASRYSVPLLKLSMNFFRPYFQYSVFDGLDAYILQARL